MSVGGGVGVEAILLELQSRLLLLEQLDDALVEEWARVKALHDQTMRQVMRYRTAIAKVKDRL